MANPIEFEAVFEEIPKAAPRPPGKGRDPVKWEEHLAPLKEKAAEFTEGKAARLWTYPAKGAAVSRMAGVRKRLTEATPADNWELKVRPVPNSDPQSFGVYVAYHGVFTAAEMKANADLHEKRSNEAKQRAAARTNGADTAEAAPETAAAPATTAKSEAAAKVAAARTAKGGKS